MKRNLRDIMHSADEKTVERIADRGNAADSETKDRILSKCLTRMDNDAEQIEIFTAEPVRRAPRFAGALIAAASLFIILGAVGLALKFKSPAPKPVDVSPIIAATGTTESSTGDEYRIVDTTETKAVSIPEASTKSAETAVTTVTTKNELWKSTVPALGDYIYRTTTTAVYPKTTAKTTKNSSKTTAAKTTTKTVTTAKTNEKRMTLAEIEEWEHKNVPSELVRERAIFNGVISADSPRITLAQVKQIIAESSNFSDIRRKIQNIQPYADVVGGSGVTLIEYWVNGSRNDYVLLCPEAEYIHLMNERGKKAEELYTPPRVTTPPVTNKPEYAGAITINDVFELSKKADLQISDFRKYCSSDDHYDEKSMKFHVYDRGDWYLKVESNNSGGIAICSLVDNVGKHSIDIYRNSYDDVLNAVNEWTFTQAITEAPLAGTLTLDDVIRLHNEKGENLNASDLSPYTNKNFSFAYNSVVKYKVIDGENNKVTKDSNVYLTLVLGNGRPLITAMLHNNDLSHTTDMINLVDYGGSEKITQFDAEWSRNCEKPWFIE